MKFILAGIATLGLALAVVLPNRYVDNQDGANGGLSFSRTVKSVSHAVGKVTFDHGCSGTDAYGSNDCNFGWGETIGVKYDVELDEDITSGKITVNTKVNRVLPLKFTCEVCGANCSITIPIIKQTIDFALPPCPITMLTLKNATSFIFPAKDPVPSGIKIKISGSVVITDQNDDEVVNVNIDGQFA